MQKVYKLLNPILSPLHAGLAPLADILLPRICLICDQSIGASKTLCEDCNPSLRATKHAIEQRCICCSVALIQNNIYIKQKVTPNNTPPSKDGALHCAQCIKQPPLYSKCISATVYNAFSGKLLNQLKHHGKLAASQPIANNMTEVIRLYYGEPSAHIDIAIPVPLHMTRLKQRGFNQASEIAKPVCRQLGIHLQQNLCIRNFDNPPQQYTGITARHKNLRGAFSSHSLVKGKAVAVIDDVVTTGATANAVTKSLLDAGAVRCDIWCFARTPRK